MRAVDEDHGARLVVDEVGLRTGGLEVDLGAIGQTKTTFAEERDELGFER